MTTNGFIGLDYEQAYSQVFKGAVVGGFRDCGRDVAIPGFGFVQVKASPDGARAFLAESLRRRKFIPICIGEPGSAAEMLKSLRQFGGWVGKEIARRGEILRGIAEVRRLCGA